MTTTVVTGTIGLGLGAAALAGAVGLGLAAAAFHAGRGRGGGYGRGHGHGGGYGGGNGGYGGYGAYGYGRRRRRGAPASPEEDESQALERILELIRQEDVTGCGLRLVCELASLEEDQLTEEELAILNLVGPALVPGEGFARPKGITDYRAAKTIGLNKAGCGEAYPSCPLNGTQLMDSVMAFLP